MSGVRIPIRDETEPRVLDTGEGSAQVVMGFSLDELQLVLRWMLYAPKETADFLLGQRLMTAYHLVAEMGPDFLNELGYCPRCLVSLPCDICGAGT